MADAGAVTTVVDGHDRRKLRVELEPRTRAQIIERAGNTIVDALATHTPELTPDERAELKYHLSEADRLLQANRERSNRLGPPTPQTDRNTRDNGWRGYGG